MTLVLCVIIVALAFEYINGFHDTANAIATSVATKVMTPGQAIVLASICNLVGAIAGVAVAKTIGKDLVDTNLVTSVTVMSALLGGIAWNLFTWWIGLPSSSSHALIGGLCGAALASAQGNWEVIHWSTGVWPKVVRPMFVAPLCGLVAGFIFMGLLLVLFRSFRRKTMNFAFGKAQLLSAAWMSFEHGRNDAQKTMGIIALTLVAATTAGTMDELPASLRFLYSPDSAVAVDQAHNNLGVLYREGRGVETDPKRAAELFRTAGKNPNAQRNLAQLLSASTDAKEQQQAQEILKKAEAEKARDPLALLFKVPKAAPTNAAELVSWLDTRANKGLSEAQNALGVMLIDGRGLAPNPERGIELIRQSAGHGNADAQFNLGVLSETGRGVTKDEKQAVLYYKQAANHHSIATWIKIACAIVMAAGTAAGGWKIIRTMGKNVVKMQPVHGFAAQTTAAAVIGVATHFGIPLSTTHVISSAIMGVGSTKRLNAVKWTVAERMVWAWIFTIPVSAILGYLFVKCSHLLGIR